MRENIGLFRGRRKDNGEWVEGAYKPEKVGEYLTDAFIIQPLTSGVWENHRVDPETVNECSGVPDRNGKMMFEGDSVKGLFLWGKEILSTVAFKDGSFGLKWMRGDIEEFYPFTSMCNVQYEIVEQEGK